MCSGYSYIAIYSVFMIDLDKNYTNRKNFFYIWQFLLETKGFYEAFAI